MVNKQNREIVSLSAWPVRTNAAWTPAKYELQSEASASSNNESVFVLPSLPP